MSAGETISFPVTELYHPHDESSIALVGLIHAVPAASAVAYDSVKRYIDARTTLPNSVVYYEAVESVSDEELLSEPQEVRERYELLMESCDLLDAIADFYGFVGQNKALYQHADDMWQNQDLSGLLVARMLPRSFLEEDVAALRQGYEELLRLSPARRAREIAWLTNKITEEEPMNELPEKEWLQVDMAREEHAVNAVLAAREEGLRHFTLLWGVAHFANYKRRFAEHGYVEV